MKWPIKIFFTALLCIVLFFSTYNSYTANVTYTIRDKYAYAGEKTCNTNGQLEFILTNFKGNLNVDDIVGIGFRFNTSNTYELLPGDWFDENYEPTRYIKYDEKAIFLSNEGFFKTPGPYTIIISSHNFSTHPLLQLNYFTGENLVDDGTNLKFEIYCPGTSHLCNPIDLNIISCNNSYDGFFAYFTGINKSKSSIDTIKDLEFNLNSRIVGGKEEYDLLPKGSSVESLGADIYRLYISGDIIDVSKSPVKNLKIKVKGCNEQYYKTIAFSSCNVPSLAKFEFDSKTFFKDEVENIAEKESPDIVIITEETSKDEAEVIEDFPALESQSEKEVSAEEEESRPNVIVRFGRWLKNIF